MPSLNAVAENNFLIVITLRDQYMFPVHSKDNGMYTAASRAAIKLS